MAVGVLCSTEQLYLDAIAGATSDPMCSDESFIMFIETHFCSLSTRVLSQSDCNYSLNPLNQTRID